jgi:hypothetical protein
MKTHFLWWLKKIFYCFLVIIFLIVCVFVVVSLATKASNDRDWNDDQKILPYADIRANSVTIHNIRNFDYTSTTSYTENYYDKTFDLGKVKKVWYIVEPFSGIPGSAHTFLSFEFENNQFVAISVEIRKEKGEAYHPVKGLFNQYELMYVIGDEKDLIKLRSNYRQDLVYVYPINTTAERARELFLDMLYRVNDLKDRPEFYNTITNTCTTNIVKHVDKITPNRVPFFNLKILLPENSDKLAYDLGLIDTNLSFEDARKRYYINDRALKYATSSDFSIKIRQEN